MRGGKACRRLLPIVFAGAGLSACSMPFFPPPPTHQTTLATPNAHEISPEATVKLDVLSTAPDPEYENDVAMEAETAVEQIKDELYFLIAGDRLFQQVVTADDRRADYTMTVTIKEFDHEAPVVTTEPQPFVGDGFNDFVADVEVEDAQNGDAVLRYSVVAATASEAFYGDSQYGPVGIEYMLDEAIEGIVEGLERGLTQRQQTQTSALTLVAD